MRRTVTQDNVTVHLRTNRFTVIEILTLIIITINFQLTINNTIINYNEGQSVVTGLRGYADDEICVARKLKVDHIALRPNPTPTTTKTRVC